MESAEAMREILHRFKECPRVAHIFSTLGDTTLLRLL